MADGFTFASFFPNVLQPPIAVVCNTIYEFLVKVRICRKPLRKYDVGAPSSITISLPGTDSHDMERRRQIALKALSERLSKQEPTQWPAMLDDEGPKSPNLELTTIVHHQTATITSSTSAPSSTASSPVSSATTLPPPLVIAGTSKS